MPTPSSVARRQYNNGADIIRVIPRSAQLYRAAVRTLNATLVETAERQEARALAAELLGGQVRVRKQGDAVYARLELDANVLLAVAANSSRNNDFQFGSGARFELYSVYRIRLLAVPASVGAAK